jgi:hypothetical protein
MPLTADQLRNLSRDEIHARSVEASQKHHRDSLGKIARRDNDEELANRLGINLTEPLSHDLDNQNS